MKATQQIHQTKLSKWSALFQEQADSGLTVREWCQQNSLSIHAFYYWKRLAKEQYVNSLMPEIVPLPITEAAPSSEASVPEGLSDSYNLHNSSPQKHSNEVTVSIGDIRISIGALASDEMISGIIKAVRNA